MNKFRNTAKIHFQTIRMTAFFATTLKSQQNATTSEATQ